MAAAVALMGGGLLAPAQPARAQALQPAVDVCTGITLPRSAVTEVIGAVNQPIVDQLETTVNDLTTVTLVLSPLASITDLNIDLSTILADAAAGDPISLQILDTEGNVLTAGSDCNLTADAYTLNNEGGISIGGNQITGLGANGQAATAAELDAIAFGNNASTAAGATGAVAIGADASATAADSVALGANSLADRESTVSVGTAGGERQIVNVADGTAATDAATVGQMNTSIAAAVADSVNYDNAAQDTLTLGGAAGTRITNVAAGTLDAGSSDAVTGAQLFATNEDVATNAADIGTLDGRVTANEGNLTALDGRVTTNEGNLTALDGRVTTNEGNLTAIDARVTTNEGGLTALDGRVTTGEARITVNEADIAALQDFAVAYDDAGQTGVTLGGADGTTISNVAAGTLDATSSDAVNGAQLFATNQGVTTNASDIAAVDGRVTLNADELDTVNGRLQLTEEELAALQGAAIVYDDSTQGTVTLAGAGGTVVTNVAAGSLDAGSTDAVNGAQLFATNQAVASNAADVATLDTRVTLNEGELATINGRLQLSEEELADLQGSAVAYDDDTKGAVTLAGADGTVVTNVAAGSVDATSSDAVNGAQLFETNQAVAAVDDRVTQNETDIATNTSDIADLQASIGDVEGTFAEVDGRITQNETHIAGLDTRVTTNEAGITALDGRVTVNEAGIAELDGRVATNEPDIAALDGRVATNEVDIAANQSAIVAVDDRVTATESDIAMIDGRVAVNEADIADINGRISTNQGNMAEMEEEIVLVAENLSGLDTRVTVNEGDIANVGARVAIAETNITAIQAQVDNIPVGYVSDADGTTPSATPTDTVALSGASGAAVRLTNVAPATLSAGSSDAVTGGQLFATNEAVNRNTADIQTINNNLAGSTVVATQYSNPGNPTVSNGGTITNDVTLVGADASAPVALHNVAAGTAPTDAVNLQQLQTGMTNTLASAMSYTDARIQQIGFDLAELRDDAFAGTAAAMAMNAIPQTMDAGKSVFGGAVGHYRGKTAFGFGLSSAFADGQAVLKVSGTIDTQGKGGVAAGAGFAF